jgi:hypothetical protein
MNDDLSAAPTAARPDGAPPVALHIDQVVLHGVALGAAQRAQLHASLAQELARLVQEAPAVWHAHNAMATPLLCAPLRPVLLSSNAASLGREIARGVFASLGSTQ